MYQFDCNNMKNGSYMLHVKFLILLKIWYHSELAFSGNALGGEGAEGGVPPYAYTTYLESILNI